MRRIRKPLALLLVLILCLSLLPAAAFAEEGEAALSAAQTGETEEPGTAAEGEAEPDPAAEDTTETENGDPNPAAGDPADPETGDPGNPAGDGPAADPENETGAGENPGGEPDADPAEEPETDPEMTDEPEEAEEAEEETEEPEGESFVFVNPLYADVVSEEDIPLAEDAAELSVMAAAPTFQTETEAADYLRNAMIVRQANVAMKLSGATGNMTATSARLFDRAVEHNGNPKAGDSLLFEYGGYSCSISKSGSTMSFSYKLKYYTTLEQEQALDSTVVQMVASLGLNGELNEYEKCLRIFEYLTENVTYDYDSSGLTKFTAYAALVKHTAVCQGYSVAFYRLALEAGVDARVISSDAMNHAWNIAGVGGSYYYLDATWDVHSYYYGSYNYFLRGVTNWLNPPNYVDNHDLGNEFYDAAFAAAYPVPESDFDLSAVLNFSVAGVMPAADLYTYDDAFQMTLQLDGDGKNDIVSAGLTFLSPSGTLQTVNAATEQIGDGTYRISAYLNNRFEAGFWSLYSLRVRSSSGNSCSIYNSWLYGNSAAYLLLEDLSALDFELDGLRTKANLTLDAVSAGPGEYNFEDTVTLRFLVSGEQAVNARVWLYSPSGFNDSGLFYTVTGNGSVDAQTGEVLCSFSVSDFRYETTDPAILEYYTCGVWELSCVELTDVRGNSVFYGEQPADLNEVDAALLEAHDLSGGNFLILPHYTVIYSSNESPDPAKNKTVTQSCKHRTWETALPNSFTRKYYVFAGWNTLPDGSGDFYADGGSFMDLAADGIGASATLYAVWEPEHFPLSYVLNGGVNHPENPGTYAYGVETQLLDASREGYAFAGWYMKKNLSGKRTESIAAGSTGAKTVYAKWTPNPDRYGILFEGNGAEAGSTKALANLAIGKKYTLPGNGFTKTGYHFAGWAENPEGEALYANKVKVMDLDLHGGSVTLYAVWEANSYTLAFQGNGGTWVYIPEGKTKAVTAKAYAQTALYDREETLEACRFTRTGYTFTGWNTKAKGTGSSYTGEETVLNLTAANKGKVTLYAQWQANSYTIRFDPGEGTGSMDAQPMVYGKSAKLNPLGFVRPGYRFTGWRYTDAAGKTKTFVDKASVKNLAAEEGSEAVLTATWAINTYHVKFSPNGGKGKVPATIKNQQYGVTTQPLPENPFSRNGYDFAGWNTKKDGSGEYYTTTDIPVAKNKVTVTLYAVWVPQA